MKRAVFGRHEPSMKLFRAASNGSLPTLDLTEHDGTLVKAIERLVRGFSATDGGFRKEASTETPDADLRVTPGGCDGLGKLPQFQYVTQLYAPVIGQLVVQTQQQR